MDDRFLTTSQAAKYFNVSPNTIRSWDKHGFIKTIRVNGSVAGHRIYDVSSFNDKVSLQKKSDVV